MTDFLDKLAAQRRKFLDGIDANEGDINLDIFEDFYPDQAHFVFELLQNAEDAEATEVSFALSTAGCLFKHNGPRLFTEKDVRSITGIHNSTKSKSADTIGKFGVGFKSVFVYTLTPEIRSGDFAFRISRLVMPERIDSKYSDRSFTRFWFPFNNPKKPKDIAFTEVSAGLRQLAETTLLFLSNISVINWTIEDEQEGSIIRVEHSGEHVEVIKESDGSTTATSHFLRFTEPVIGLKNQKIAIAFRLDLTKDEASFKSNIPLVKQFKISPVDGQVAVFFPAEKETSGLRFHLHAPFMPELSRASIKDTPVNAPLFEQLASLSVTTLHGLKALGFLTPDFLGVLPNCNDQLGKNYVIIREKITAAFNAQPFTPTFSKGHAPARHLVQSKASLKALLTEEDIEFLVNYDEVPPQWAASRALQGTNIERFMSDLAIETWDVDDFLEELISKLGVSYSWLPPDPDAKFEEWITKKPVDWIQQLYALLASEAETKDGLHQLRSAKIVKLMDGTFGIPAESYFPDDKGRYEKIVPCVDRRVLEGGSSEKRKKFASTFLSDIGVTSIGERQLIGALLEKNYSSSEHTFNKKDHSSHLKRIVKLVKDEPTSKAMVKRFKIFLGSDGQWHRPEEIFLDSPFMQTGLSDYFKIIESSETPAQLNQQYLDISISASNVAELAETLGAHKCLQIHKSCCSKNPDWHYLSRVPGERATNVVNKDYTMVGFDKLAIQKSVKISRLIWETMREQPSGEFLKAQYRLNFSGGSHYAKSRLVHQLQSSAWIPQSNGFAKPSEARVELLPEGFSFDPGWPWIKAIEFGSEIERADEKARAEAEAAQARNSKKQAAAAELGFETEDMELLNALSELSSQERNEILEESRRRKNASELPEHEPTNRERRDKLVREIAKGALGRETEKRSRNVSVGQGAAKEEAKQYLRHQYTGDDGLVCQVCEKPMPFTLDDGTPYFEAVEFLPEKELKKRHHQNYIALCPNHAAMFRHANGSKDIMQAMLMDILEERLEVLLAQTDCTIYFTKTHIADLKSIVHAEDEDL